MSNKQKKFILPEDEIPRYEDQTASSIESRYP